MSDSFPANPVCMVPGCAQDAAYQLYLKDDIPGYGPWQEEYHPISHSCHDHAVLNEAGAQGIRADGAYVSYPLTPTNTSGFIRYKSLKTGRFLLLEDSSYPALKRPIPVRDRT